MHIRTYVHTYVLSYVRLFATPWTVACQAPHPWEFPGKNTRVDCHFLLQGIFPTQGLNPCLLCLGRRFLAGSSFPLSHLGSPIEIPLNRHSPYSHTHIRPQNAGDNSLMWFTLFWWHSGKLRFTVIGLIGYFYLCNGWGWLHQPFV